MGRAILSDVDLVSSPAALPSSPERPRDARILNELARAGAGRIGFQALRRSLDLHPQALARSLRQLQSAGLVERDASGYRLARPVPASESPSVPAKPVFASLVPPFVDRRILVERLERRWFQGLRWYGLLQESDEQVLVWSTEDGSAHVRLRVGRQLVGVEVQSVRPGPDPLVHVAPLMAALAAYYGDAAKNAIEVPRTAG